MPAPSSGLFPAKGHVQARNCLVSGCVQGQQASALSKVQGMRQAGSTFTSSASSDPEQPSDPDNERFAALRRKAGKLARQVIDYSNPTSAAFASAAEKHHHTKG